MKTIAACRRFAFALILLAGAALPDRACAVFVFDVAQVGPDVDVTGSGTLDITDLSFVGSFGVQPQVDPSTGRLIIGLGGGVAQVYQGISGPSNDGTGSTTTTPVGTGGPVGVNPSLGWLYIPNGYVSGTPLTASSTFDNTTLAGLGFTPGTYTYTWGRGPDADSLTVTSLVPEPSTWALLGVGMAGLGVTALRRRARRA